MKKKSNVDRVFQALGDPTRRRMLEKISAGPLSVSELAEPFRISLAAVVQHLQVLEDCKLIRTEKLGRTRTCNIERSGFEAAERWIAQRRSLWDKRFERLGELL